MKFFKLSLFGGIGVVVLVVFLSFVQWANSGQAQANNEQMANCQEITINAAYYTHDSIQRCEMPDGAVCYLFGSYGSISCLDPSLMGSNLR